MATVSAIILALCGIIGTLLKMYVSSKPERDQVTHERELQQGRQNIVDGNIDAVSERIDRLLSLELQDGRPSGKPDGKAAGDGKSPV